MPIEIYILKIFFTALKYFCFFSVLKYYRFPLPVSAIISFSLALSFYKNFLDNFSNTNKESILSSSLPLQEIFMGMTLALPWIIFFEFLPLALKLFDILRGVFIAEQQFPGIESRQSSLEGLGTYLTVILFFYLAGYQQMLEILFLKKEVGNLYSLFNFILISSNEVLKLSFKMIFPIMTILFFQEILQIVLLKLLPRLNLGTEFQNFKLCFSLFLLILLLENNIPQLLSIFSSQINDTYCFWKLL